MSSVISHQSSLTTLICSARICAGCRANLLYPNPSAQVHVCVFVLWDLGVGRAGVGSQRKVQDQLDACLHPDECGIDTPHAFRPYYREFCGLWTLDTGHWCSVLVSGEW